MSIKYARSRQAGLTLIELIVFIMVIGIAVVTVMGALANISAHSVDPLLRKQAMLRAESLLEEVSLAHFTYCHPDDANAETATSTAGCASLPEAAGPRPGDTRPYFNINDYVSAYGAATSFNAADPSGETITDVTGAVMLPAGYQAKVTVKPVSGFGPTGMQLASTEVLHISVTVLYGPAGPNRESVVLDRYRTRYAPNSMP
ncbi:MAG: type II secretion system protein [Pseudomonadota bacterium]